MNQALFSSSFFKFSSRRVTDKTTKHNYDIKGNEAVSVLLLLDTYMETFLWPEYSACVSEEYLYQTLQQAFSTEGPWR